MTFFINTDVMHIVSKAATQYDKKINYLNLSLCIWCCSKPKIHQKKEPLIANHECKTSILLLTFPADGI